MHAFEDLFLFVGMVTFKFQDFFSGKPALPTLSLAKRLIALMLIETIAYFNPSNYT